MLLAAALLSAGCAQLRVPDGMYTNADGVGTLTVREDRVEIAMPTENPSTPYDKGDYGYSLFEDGSVQFHGSSNSSYYLLVVLDYQWYWNGSAFERKDRRDGTIVTFTPVQ